MKSTPRFSEFKQMARAGNLIPVYKEFLTDTATPVSAYLKLKDDSYTYLLESGGGVQFHPESILTKTGINILQNFLIKGGSHHD